jgi:hypothetical protein
VGLPGDAGKKLAARALVGRRRLALETRVRPAPPHYNPVCCRLANAALPRALNESDADARTIGPSVPRRARDGRGQMNQILSKRST